MESGIIRLSACIRSALLNKHRSCDLSLIVPKIRIPARRLMPSDRSYSYVLPNCSAGLSFQTFIVSEPCCVIYSIGFLFRSGYFRQNDILNDETAAMDRFSYLPVFYQFLMVYSSSSYSLSKITLIMLILSFLRQYSISLILSLWNFNVL